MATLDQLLDRVHDEFPAVPKALALRALSDSTREFCVRTKAWQEDIDPIPLVVGTLEYEIGMDAGVRIVMLVEVRRNGRRLDPLMTEYRNLASSTARRSLPDGYFQSGPDTLELVHEPLETGMLQVRAALTLAMGSATTSVPDTLVQDHGEAIAAGAKMRLVRQSGQPWSKPELVPIYAGPYYDQISNTKSRVNSALGAAQGRIEFRRW